MASMADSVNSLGSRKGSHDSGQVHPTNDRPKIEKLWASLEADRDKQQEVITNFKRELDSQRVVFSEVLDAAIEDLRMEVSQAIRREVRVACDQALAAWAGRDELGTSSHGTSPGCGSRTPTGGQLPQGPWAHSDDMSSMSTGGTSVLRQKTGRMDFGALRQDIDDLREKQDQLRDRTVQMGADLGLSLQSLEGLIKTDPNGIKVASIAALLSEEQGSRREECARLSSRINEVYETLARLNSPPQYGTYTVPPTLPLDGRGRSVPRTGDVDSDPPPTSRFFLKQDRHPPQQHCTGGVALGLKQPSSPRNAPITPPKESARGILDVGGGWHDEGRQLSMPRTDIITETPSVAASVAAYFYPNARATTPKASRNSRNAMPGAFLQ